MKLIINVIINIIVTIVYGYQIYFLFALLLLLNASAFVT